MNYITKKYPVKRLFRKLLFFLARRGPFIPGKIRAFLFSLGGLNFEDYRSNFVGYDVAFDDINPELISIGRNSFITEGCKILTHFVDTSFDDFDHHTTGKVTIGNNVFIGVNVIISKSIIIGDGAVVGAGSVLTKDVAPYTIVAGNPARVIKKREIE